MRSRSFVFGTLIAAGTTVMFGVTAEAQNRGGHDREARNYCSNHPRDRDCQAHRRGAIRRWDVFCAKPAM